MVILDVLKALFGAIFILFMPGFAWSFVLFKKDIQWVERAAISFGLSIAIVPLTVFWLSWLFHVRITLLNTSLTVCALVLAPVVYLLTRQPSLREHALDKTRSIIRFEGIRQVFRRREH